MKKKQHSSISNHSFTQVEKGIDPVCYQKQALQKYLGIKKEYEGEIRFNCERNFLFSNRFIYFNESCYWETSNLCMYVCDSYECV